MGIKHDRTQSNLAGMYPALVIWESKTVGHCEVMSLGKQLFSFLYISGQCAGMFIYFSTISVPKGGYLIS